MNRNCASCKKEFTIEQNDLSYYEKIKVPPPTWCPKCRLIRRMATINCWYLFYRNCDKCGKRTLSMYPPEQKITVYCQPCWWADDWDGTEYGMDYDPKRPFFEQLKELSEKTPYVALETTYLTLKNCDYSNSLAYSKNCTLAIWADYCENVCYSSFLTKAKDTADSLRIFSSELCYESIGQRKSCYRSFYSQECDSCSDIYFCRNCYGSMNCIGCANLRGANYKIFNVQYSREEYLKKLKELKLNTRAGLKNLQKEAEAFWRTLPYRSYTGDTFNVNVTGDYVYQSRNSKEIYSSSHVENCKWCQFVTVKPAKDCMDYSGWGNNALLIYESANVGEDVSNTKFSCYSFPQILNSEYVFFCTSVKNDFGCVNLKRKNYSILNKQYEKSEYEKLKAQIIEDMKKNPYRDELGQDWYYGEFFQPGFSKFAYNNSNAFKFFPKTKEEALRLGYTWNEEIDQAGVATIKGEDLPETISEVEGSILNEIISCANCKRKYKILSLELSLLRKMNIPLPDWCYRCREDLRFRKINMPILYDRNCMKCNLPVRTPYASDRPEVIYCEKCYQQEIY